MMDRMAVLAGLLRRVPRWLWLAAGLWMMASLSWVNAQPESAGLIPAPWDKLAHAAVFGLIAMSLALGASRRWRWWAVCLVAAFGAVDELRQLALPGRTPSWSDWGTDVLAAVAAVWLTSLLPGPRRASRV